jgi:ABC-type sugar transport system substrate-binding protein
MKHITRRAVLIAVACVGLVLSATAYAAVNAATAKYKGVEAKYPHTYAAPTGKAKAAFTVGYLSPNASVLNLKEQLDGAASVVKAHGGKLIPEDAVFNVQTQVSQFQDLLAEHVSAIILFGLDPTSLAPSLAQAKADGIPVVSVDQPVDLTQARAKNITTNFELGRDQEAFYDAKEAATLYPHSTVAIVGTASPVTDLKYITARQIYWSKYFGLKVVGQVDATTDNEAGASAAMSAVLARYHGVQVVMAYNDATAEAAAATALSSGHKSVHVLGINGETPAIHDVLSGRLVATVLQDGTADGAAEGTAATDLVLKQHLPLPKTVVGPIDLITKANAKHYLHVAQ